MYPYIFTPLGTISTFTVFIALGVISMLLLAHLNLKQKNKIEEESFLFPRLALCGLFGFAFAAFFDFVFKFIEYREVRIYGLCFYGGLIGAVIAFYIVLTFSNKKTQISKKSWFEIMTIPFVSFHFFGRIGCFFAGCCYGKNSNSILALDFPDNSQMGIFHKGAKCYPTQLFEAAILLCILVLLIFVKQKFKTYMFLYASARFFLEFLRGDDRGTIVNVLSPSQCISIFIISIIVINSSMRQIIRIKQNKKLISI